MKQLRILSTSLLAVGVVAGVSPVQADTVEARCDVFPRGEDKATSSGLCTFSQRQGFVSIQLKDGTRYELRPSASSANAYLDGQGRPASVESLEPNRGQVYRLATQSVFVFWDPSPYQKGAAAGGIGSASGTGSATPSGLKPEFWVVNDSSTFLKASPGIFARTVTNALPQGTVLRNLGCQSQRTPTWCQVEQRDNPKVKGWVWSTGVSEFAATPVTPEAGATETPAVGASVARLRDLVGSRAGQAENVIEQRGYSFVRSEPSGDAMVSYWREANTNACVIIRTFDGRYASIVYGSSSCP
jgi:hypothetical protein